MFYTSKKIRICETMRDYSATIFELVNYEVLCTIQAVDSLVCLSDDECKHNLGFGLQTPHRTIFHIMDVMQGWSGCVGPVIQQPSWLAYEESITLQEIREQIVAIGDTWLTVAKKSHRQGLLTEERRLHQLFHLITHGTHHRGELLSMVTLLGYEHPFEGGDFDGWSNNAVSTD